VSELTLVEKLTESREKSGQLFNKLEEVRGFL
jgi:hypothetical protein